MIAVLVALAALWPAPGSAPAAQTGNGIQATLDARASAVLAGDQTAFMATIDRSDPEFVRRQRLLFRGFRDVGLSDYRLEATDRYWDELTGERERRRYGEHSRATVLHVEEHYAIEGYDDHPALDDLYLTFVRRAGGWVIASDSDLDDLTLFSSRKLWEFGPVVTRQSNHFLFVSHPGLADAADDVLAASERALAALGATWRLPWSERVVILAPSTTDELRRLIQANFDLEVFVAFAFSGVDRTHDWDLVGHRIVLNWPSFSRYSDQTRETILTHELLHIATREYAGPHVPAWVDEGVAEVVAGDVSTSILSGRVTRGDFDRHLPEDFEFVAGADQEILNSYEESYTSMRYAVDRWGEDAMAEFYRRVGEVRLAPGTWRYHVGRAMRGAFSIGFERFESDWADWVEANYG